MVRPEKYQKKEHFMYGLVEREMVVTERIWIEKMT